MVLSDISIRRPVFAMVINLVVLLVGVIAYDRLAVRQIPNVDTPVVTVNTSYPGASAQVIESQVTQPIEDALSGVEGVEFMQSVSREQSSQVTIRFRLDRDPDGAASDVRDRVAQAREVLPDEVDEPIIQKQEADQQPIIYLAFSSDRHSQVEIADYAERLVKDRIQTIPGVAQAQVFASTFAMRVWLQPQRLAGFGLTPADVERALRAQNVEIPAGRVEGSAREFTVLSETDLKTPEQFGEIILGNVDGYLVRLKDVARVELGAQEQRFRARYNGVNAVPLAIIKQAVANPLDISASLKTMLPEIQRTLPQGMKIEIAFDTTIFIEKSIDEVYTTVAEAVVLVIIVIFLFLRSWRATLIPLVTIPVSLIGAFGLMYAFGFTINTLTLLAMVLAIGLVVDDAIVMLENIYRHIEEGMPPFQAALKGSKEIGFAIVAMTLTLAAVYVPLAFSTGRTGKLFVEFALTLAGAVLVSGFTALTLSPMMSSKLLRHETKHGRFYQAGEKVLGWIDRSYRSVLGSALRFRWIVVGAAAVIFIGAYLTFSALPKELAPEEDQGFIIGFGMAPEGSTPEYTDKYAKQMESMFAKIPDVQQYFQIVGFPAVTNTIGFVMLKDWDDREVSTADVSGQLFPQFMGIPGVMAFPTLPPPLGQDGFGQPVSFVVQSTGTWEDLGETVQKLMAKMAENPRLTNPDSDLKLDKPQLKVALDRDKVAAVGSTVDTVGHTLETLLGGRNVTRFKKGSEQYDVIVQVEDADRRTPGDLSNIFVRGGDGQMVQLSNLVSVEETVAAKELNHFNKLRAATVSAGLAPGYSQGEALEWMEAALREVAPTAQYDLSGQSREFRESSSDFTMILALAVVFIFLVLAAQFESWVDPLVILLAVPLAMFGAFLALKLTGGSWNIYSQIGIVTLVGLIAKHGILIVEFSNQLQEQGKSKFNAVIDAAALRLRPILMTTGAMVLGSLPLAIASGAGAEARNQIGWVIVGGMAIGTLFTLFVVPVVYLLIGRDHQKAAAAQASLEAAPAH
ncbi:efflux RND transporter permease subunit [Montanilutibacter psychrotolerans]|uniref:Efflux RND transporter permease subunit n=1 Tax=Montanilutibacter psychrotolerans TaxID=1327343 RepID=A0A3M8SSN8_9GAMM|nr:efflux RND transporter permease subunit [Lysobacter psychrotolerans]RNF82234.1 efflux RND transporter permease subunit [Lysobacter psychrotolerans]